MDRSKVVLLLEDNKLEIMKARRAFDKLGITNPLAVCENGVEGLAWLREHEVDLPGIILLDLNMPRMNGLEFLKIVKEDDVFRNIPIVVLTTSTDLGDRIDCYNKQVAGYMVKPLKFGDYLNVIQTIETYWEKSELPY